jgi:PrcB C-terminal
MRPLKHDFVVCVAVGALVACGGTGPDQRASSGPIASGGSVPAGASSVPVRRVQPPAYYSAFQTPARLLIKDAASWASAWDQIAGHASLLPPLPAVDFSTEMVIVLAMGSKPSSGYGIAITAVARDQTGALFVAATETSPAAKDCGLLTVITSPVDFVIIPRSDANVSVVSQQAQSCG